MSYIELFLLAVSLSFDTFAVSLTGGMCLKERLRWSQAVKIFFFFAAFQTGFTFLGWFLGYSVSEYIEKFDHWIAFFLLAYIGGKMIAESLKKKKETGECDPSKGMDLLDTSKLSILSIATSIDALAVGISLAIVDLTEVKIFFEFAAIFIVTAAASLVGLFGGKKLGGKSGKRSELVGGLILIAIGVKILLQHLFFQ
ncbi:MAG: manganese efflux pump MntP family protein [Bacteroidales bacterium]|jgi:putative Mn2+ efflux pump MntP|nr:manganese efflux pump MntP family protein [Bacteroidales bacterium]